MPADMPSTERRTRPWRINVRVSVLRKSHLRLVLWIGRNVLYNAPDKSCRALAVKGAELQHCR
jgi:hypothetical protein